ncbi:MAG: glycosyltransferase family 2 protein [Deltaproteobacteria bacterium]|nr:glycosyltransferase family 2 protein [Deltaproteobacteria bacterium]
MSTGVKAVSSSTTKTMLVLLPALNEAYNISEVIQEVQALNPRPDVLVIDDGSSDETGAIAARMGARVITMPFNCGIGASVQAGLRFGLERGYALIARLDSDGQHDPSALNALRVPIDAGEADFVLGSRYLEKGGFASTFARRLGRRWFTLLLRLVCRLRITDPTSGCWMANRTAAAVLHREHSFDYPEVDSLVYLQRNRCAIQELPVTMRSRFSGRSSIDGSKILYYMLKVTIALLIGRVRSPMPSDRSMAEKSKSDVN